MKFQLGTSHGISHKNVPGLVYLSVEPVNGDPSQYLGAFGGYVRPEVSALLLAAPAYEEHVSNLASALTALLKAIDDETANRDGEHCIQPDTGCIECTLGTVPNDQNTGLCAYHSAKKLLQSR